MGPGVHVSRCNDPHCGGWPECRLLAETRVYGCCDDGGHEASVHCWHRGDVCTCGTGVPCAHAIVHDNIPRG